MGLQIRCYVEGNQEFIELYGNEDIDMEVSFAEIQDITKKNSAFTKQFKVPGSKNNNYIFNYFFDINSVYLNWNPKKKFEADLIYDGYELYNGYIRLNSVEVDKIEKVYSITFYNGVGDVAANIGDKLMRNLDLSSINHPMSDLVYLESQTDPNLFTLTGTTNYSYQNGKTFWGLYNIGYLYTEDTSNLRNFYVSNSTTSLTIEGGNKTLTITPASTPWSAGDTCRLTHSTSQWMEGKVISYDRTTGTMVFDPDLGLGTGTHASWTATLQIAEGVPINDIYFSPYLLWSAATPGYFSFSGTPLPFEYLKPSIQVKELYNQIFNQAGYSVESDFFNTSYFEKIYLPLKFSEDIYTLQAVQPCYTYTAGTSELIFGIINASNTTCNNFSWNSNANGFRIPSGYQGYYTFEVELDYCSTNDPNTSGNPNIKLELFVNGSFEYIIEEDYRGPGCWTTITQFSYQVPNANTDIGVFLTTSPNFTGNSFTFRIKSGPKFNPLNFDYALEFPEKEFKQIDFITSVNRMFNLVCVPSPIKPKTIIVEPIIDYIGKGQILDWTEKVDWDSSYTLSPTTDILNGTLAYNFKLDKDNLNETFNQTNNRIFGTDEIKLGQDYKDSTIEFNFIFGSPIDAAMNNPIEPLTTYQGLYTVKQKTVKDNTILQILPYKTLPRLVFRGLVYPNENYSNFDTNPNFISAEKYYLQSYPQYNWQEINRYTTYPFFYTGFSHYLNFRSSDIQDTNETHFPQAEDLYDIYYFDYIDDLTSNENKIFNAKIYLLPWEVAALRFDEKILIKNAYFRINKISNLSLLEPGLCNIQLVKLTKDYTPHPVKYFDLINCNTGGTDYHTTSDLNYNIYAYVGNYVNIYTGSTTAYTSIGCFQVVEGQPNASYDYEPIFIGSGYSNSSVNVFNDCNCTGQTAFDIVQQV